MIEEKTVPTNQCPTAFQLCVESMREVASRSIVDGGLKGLKRNLPEDLEPLLAAFFAGKLAAQFKVPNGDPALWTGEPIMWAEVAAELKEMDFICSIDIARISTLLEEGGIIKIHNAPSEDGGLCCRPGPNLPRL